ncbi:MAG: TIGR03067 domain-containing protein [Planctomycetia bacterium]|nr:TIGR03067 domain-containing protein [Planctomycetia bacterium]
MRYSLGSLVLFAACATLIAAPVPKEKPAVKDEEAIIGIWSFEKFDTGGEGDANGPPQEELAKMRLEFKKDGKMTISRGQAGKEKNGTYKLDPSAKVKTIDFIDERRTSPGIYELNGDTLKLCIAEGNNAARPTEMKPDGKRMAVVTLKRVKDEKKDEKKEK